MRNDITNKYALHSFKKIGTEENCNSRKLKIVTYKYWNLKNCNFRKLKTCNLRKLERQKQVLENIFWINWNLRKLELKKVATLENCNFRKLKNCNLQILEKQKQVLKNINSYTKKKQKEMKSWLNNGLNSFSVVK